MFLVKKIVLKYLFIENDKYALESLNASCNTLESYILGSLVLFTF